jgi:hypothetical protein
MAITVQERHQERETALTRNGPTAQRIFQVILGDDEASYTDLQILSTAGLPRPYERHPNFSTMVADRSSVRRFQDDLQHCHVIVDYILLKIGTSELADKDAVEGGGNSSTDDPTKLPDQVYFRGITSQVFDGRAYGAGDTQGNPTKPLMNSARWAFDTPPPRPIGHLLIIVKRNISDEDYNPEILRDYRETLNSYNTKIGSIAIPAKCGYMRDIVADPAYWTETKTEDGETTQTQKRYYTITFEIQVASSPHTTKILDQGPWYLNGANTPVPFKGANDIEYQGRLDGSGGALSETTPPAEPTAGVYLSFDLSFPKDWAPLRLPVNRSGAGI